MDSEKKFEYLLQAENPSNGFCLPLKVLLFEKSFIDIFGEFTHYRKNLLAMLDNFRRFKTLANLNKLYRGLSVVCTKAATLEGTMNSKTYNKKVQKN